MRALPDLAKRGGMKRQTKLAPEANAEKEYEATTKAGAQFTDTPSFTFEEPDEISDDLRTNVAGLLGGAPIALDDLVRETGEPAGVIAGILLELELAGTVTRETDATYRQIT